MIAELILSVLPLNPSAQAEPCNLLPNGSFEVGATPAWWGITGAGSGLITNHCLDDSTPLHGRVSLKLPLLARTLFSGPVQIPEVGQYTFSAWLRADVPVDVSLSIESERQIGEYPQDAHVYGSSSGKIGTEWIRLVLSVALPNEVVNVRITPTENDPAKSIWIDAISLTLKDMPDAAISKEVELNGKRGPLPEEEDDNLEELVSGRKEPSFRPRSELEAGLSCDVPAKVFYNGQRGSVLLKVANTGNRAREAKFYYWVTDLYGRESERTTLKWDAIDASHTLEEPLILDTSLNGIFSLRGQLDAGADDIAEIVYVVIPEPGETTILAAHTTISPSTLAALRRLGICWYNGLTDDIFRLGNLRPDRERFVWFDREVGLLPQHGMQGIGFLEYFLARGDFSWALGPVKEFDPPIVMRKKFIERLQHLRPELWEDHARQILSHYHPTIRNWVIDDEVDHEWTPAMYLDVLRQTRRVAQSVNPEIRIAISANVHWFEELVDLGGVGFFDAMGGSIGGAPYWDGIKMGWMKQKYKKDVWVTGIFAYGASFYRTHVPESDWLDRAKGIYGRMMRCFFLQRASNVAPYIFRFTIFSSTRMMDKTFFDFDGTVRSNGFGFVAAGSIFAGMEPDLEPIPIEGLPEGSCLLYGFTKKGKRGLILYGDGQRIHLPLPPGKVQVLDWLENPITQTPDKGKCISARAEAIEVTPDGSAIYIYDHDLGAREFSRRIRQARLLPPPGEIAPTALFLVRDGELGRAAVHINLDKTEHDEIPAGGAKIVHFENQPNPFLNRPIENDGACWLANCLPVGPPITIDGDLAEWDKRSACWMVVDWRYMAPRGRSRMHILSGGQFINYQPWYDFKVGYYASYDAENLYFAFRVNDDDVAPAPMAADGIHDGVQIFLDTDILGDLGTDFGSSDDHLIKVRLLSPRTMEAERIHLGKHSVLEVSLGRHSRGYAFELAIPLKDLDLPGNPSGQAIGLDVIAFDADYDARYPGEERFKREQAELRWAAGARLGTLFFGPDL